MTSLIHTLRTLESISIKWPRSLLTNSIKNTKMGCSSSKLRISNASTPSPDASAPVDSEFVEAVVCRTEDVPPNTMKSFDLADAGKVLVVHQNGQFSALGAKCTHYGAPLSGAALGAGRIRCQWHGACFNATTGDIEDYPGLDSLPCHEVALVDGEVRVRARRADLATNKRTRPLCARAPADRRHFVIVGGGPAAATCAETLRQEGFAGAVTMVCKEPCLPYDRVKVSKSMDFDIRAAEFRTADFYATHAIDVLLDTSATSLDAPTRSITLSTGATLKYDKAFVATGMQALKADVPGAELANVFVLRDWAHSQAAEAQLGAEKEVVVLGSSFVAMEAAFYCVAKVRKVTLVARGNAPFKPLVGERVGLAFKALFEAKGVHFVMESGIRQCLDGTNLGRVSEVELISGKRLKADIVIMGVGSICYTQFLGGSGLTLRADGSIEVDEHLATPLDGVYAGGDIAHAPVWSHNNQKSTIGHYPLAHYHGRIAALNMLGKETQLRAVPYFWTMVFGKGLRYAGHGQFDDIVYVGDVEALKFVAFYLNGGEVVAASSVGMDPVVSQFAEMLAQGRKLRREDVEGDDGFKWTSRLHEK